MRDKQVRNKEWAGFQTGHLLSNPPRERNAILSEVLETGRIPERYFLSQKACSGILRRAERRGKELPPALKMALEAVAQARERSEETEPEER